MANRTRPSAMLNCISGARHSELLHPFDTVPLRRFQMIVRDTLGAAHETHVQVDSLNALRPGMMQLKTGREDAYLCSLRDLQLGFEQLDYQCLHPERRSRSQIQDLSLADPILGRCLS